MLFKFLLLVSGVAVCLAGVRGAEIRTPEKRSTDLHVLQEAIQEERDLSSTRRAEDLFLRFLDAVIEHEREQGASEEEVGSLMRKRSGIRKCFFHAVNCW